MDPKASVLPTTPQRTTFTYIYIYIGPYYVSQAVERWLAPSELHEKLCHEVLLGCVDIDDSHE